MITQRHRILANALRGRSHTSLATVSTATGTSPVAPPRHRRSSGNTSDGGSNGGNGGRRGDDGDGGNGPAVMAAIPATTAAAVLGPQVSLHPAGGVPVPSTSTPTGHSRQSSDSGRGLSVSSILRSQSMPGTSTGEMLLMLDASHHSLRSNFHYIYFSHFNF